ncbi:MAG: hypothetical protein M0C28_48850 [Candidatus Moduliflexus flocculans]|nr:hypothetical protein [Candidatus Moduliflexus flocculans]
MRDGRALQGGHPGRLVGAGPDRPTSSTTAMDFDVAGRRPARCSARPRVIVMDDRDATCSGPLADIARFYAHESCGQCTPCRDRDVAGSIRRCGGSPRAGAGARTSTSSSTRPTASRCGPLCPLGDAAALPMRALVTKFQGRARDGAGRAGSRSRAEDGRPCTIDGLATSTRRRGPGALLRAAAGSGDRHPALLLPPRLRAPWAAAACAWSRSRACPSSSCPARPPCGEGHGRPTRRRRASGRPGGDVLEFLLADHPLDCPVCDKAGECRLQDQSRSATASSPSRFLEAKAEEGQAGAGSAGASSSTASAASSARRCVRLPAPRSRGTGELGVFERGVRAEIGVYEESRIDNGYAGNLVDICPVGAITDRDFRFRTRTWFLEKRPSVCPRCGRGCAVVVESVAGHPLGPGERRVFRVRAAENPAVNGWWMCDLGRAGRRDADEGRARSSDALLD